MNDVLHKKYAHLNEILKKLERVAVAYSGGVDSTFLLKAAKDVLGDNVFAITMNLCSFPRHELEETVTFCKQENIAQMILEFHELEIPGFAGNDENRCYLCKKQIFSLMKKKAEENGRAVLVEGSNTDDENDYRPGRKAIKELNIVCPLKEAELSKDDIRCLSKELGLPTWNKPSFACLSTRFPYGEPLTEEKLSMVEAAENILFQYGLLQVRVRCHGNIARIELLPEDFSLLMKEDVRREVVLRFKQLGFVYVSLDLQGYRGGSMNEVL